MSKLIAFFLNFFSVLPVTTRSDHLRNDRRHDQKRHAHSEASKPEETKQSSKTAGRATVAARKCWYENYPARGVTVPQRHPQSKQW